jgi:hypothetical protein
MSATSFCPPKKWGGRSLISTLKFTLFALSVSQFSIENNTEVQLGILAGSIILILFPVLYWNLYLWNDPAGQHVAWLHPTHLKNMYNYRRYPQIHGWKSLSHPLRWLLVIDLSVS